jgi:ACS family hexuronate transporter-like MFS transporter
VIRARLTSMLAGVILMTAGVLAAYPIHIAASIAVISVAAFGFGLWAPNMMSLCADGFPSHLIGSVTGLTGVGAGVGGMVFTLSTGWMLDHVGYAPVFVAAGISPLLAYATLHVLLGADGLPLARERARR